jgi:AraC-like DNA-binding protein
MEPTFGSRTQTSDVDVARQLLGEAYLPLEVEPVGLGPLDLHMNAVRLPVMTAGYVSFGGEVKLRGDEVDSYHIDVPLTGHAVNTWDDGQRQVAVAGQSAGVFMPGIPVDIGWSPGCGQICLMLSAKEMRRQLEAMLDRPVLTAVHFERSLDLTTRSAKTWLQLVTVLERETDQPSGAFSHPLAAHNLQHLLVQGLLLMQPHNYTEALQKEDGSGSPKVVTRAVELMRAQPEAPWTTARLARQTGVSVRALQKAFERADELPPMTYLRHLRLHRAHAVLSTADPQSVTVTSVASRWGFLHFGRFAQQYRQIFGESPSATLRVNRNLRSA